MGGMDINVKVYYTYSFGMLFTHKLHLKMGPGPFLEQSSTVKFQY